MAWAVRPIWPRTLAKIVYVFIYSFCRNRDSRDNLIMLLELEREILMLTGLESRRYGNGIHTKHRHTNYHVFFTKALQEGERVLDIGCGDGALAYDMANTGAYVTGIGMNEESIVAGQERFKHKNLKILYGRAEQDFPNTDFDTIVMSNVLEHMDQRVSFLKRVQKTIKPKRWLFRVPMYERDWRVPLMQELGVDYRLDNTHFIEYTKQQLMDELTKAGH